MHSLGSSLLVESLEEACSDALVVSVESFLLLASPDSFTVFSVVVKLKNTYNHSCHRRYYWKNRYQIITIPFLTISSSSWKNALFSAPSDSFPRSSSLIDECSDSAKGQIPLFTSTSILKFSFELESGVAEGSVLVSFLGSNSMLLLSSSSCRR